MSDEKEKETSAEKALFPIKIKLSKPLDTSDGDVNELVINREPNGGDWAGLNITSPTTGDFLRIGSKLTGIPFPYLKRIGTRETFEMVNVISDFLD